MFDPALAAYWGHADLDRATSVCLDIIAANAAKVDGVKVSLLDKHREIAMRRRLPRGMRMYTGDDFNFAELIAGDEHGYSDALLGIFDPIASAASAALAALAAGDRKQFDAILAPTVPLSRHVFRAPTRFYKTGVVFLAWLNGHQDHFVMVGGQQSARSLLHFVELFELPDAAGLFTDVDRAGRKAALDDNKRAVDEALTLGAPCLVLVVGGLPKDTEGRIASKDLSGAREMVRDGIGELLQYARPAGMPLALEPLHP